MRIRFTLKGRTYSENKDTFKDILKKHGLRWRGSFDNPWWGDNREKVSAIYERDEVRRITISASLTWEGDEETPFLKEFRSWAKVMNAIEERVKRSQTKTFVDDLMFYEMVYKPQVAHLEASGRPKSWIERDVKRWEEEREQKFGD